MLEGNITYEGESVVGFRGVLDRTIKDIVPAAGNVVPNKYQIEHQWGGPEGAWHKAGTS